MYRTCIYGADVFEGDLEGVPDLYVVARDGGPTVTLRQIPVNVDVVLPYVTNTNILGRLWFVCNIIYYCVKFKNIKKSCKVKDVTQLTKT